MYTVLVLAFLAAFILSLILTVIIRKVAARIGFVDRPGGRKRHDRATPFGGGIAVCLGTSAIILGAAATAYLWKHHPSSFTVPDTIAEDVSLAYAKLPVLLCVLAGGLAIGIVGLVDDIRPVRPRTKLIFQFAIAIAVVAISGIRISAFIPAGFIQVALTVLWIVLLTNSFNLLDNMDGLSGTVAFICTGALLILAIQTMQYFIAGLLVALMGAILGFLLFNLPPAGIFLGDSGSMFVGYMLATATVLTTFLSGRQTNPLFPLLVPAILFAVPLYDTVSVLAIRLRHKKPVMVGDQNHFSHRLERLGMSQRRVLLTIGLVTLATALGATLPYGSSSWRVFVPAVQALAIICVIIELELASAGKC